MSNESDKTLVLKRTPQSDEDFQRVLNAVNWILNQASGPKYGEFQDIQKAAQAFGKWYQEQSPAEDFVPKEVAPAEEAE